MVRRLFFRLAAILTVFLLATNLIACTPASLVDFSAGEVYQQKSPSSDGIGKVYMGREIAKVMGHEAAYWLERSSRRWEEQPDQAIDALELQPTDIVADIGAGTGFFSFRISPFVPDGKVLAVDVQPEMLGMMDQVIEQDHIVNVETVQGSPTDPNLPEAIDLALMVDAYHEFDYPKEIMQRLVSALKPGGQVVMAEYRGENPFIPIKRLHKMSQRQVKREMQAVGLVWRKTEEFLPLQHLMFFEKPYEVEGRLPK
ncbi:MAG: methyltransferase domain-containing protein [Leptolyngbyaceae cyanobacterium MO_188.B28]|nr:methyltransferase domain-containing protein [Leptolyngbyaceae cyanobacterium MO_188.B28]